MFKRRDREAVKPAGFRGQSLSAFGGSNPPPCNKMKLALFDVDGILLKSGSVTFDYWNAVSKKHFGLEVDSQAIYVQGKTDRQILAELLKLKGIEEPENDKRFLAALQGIGEVVSNSIKGKKLELVPNVEAFIKRLIQEKVFLGLLTGNTREKAEAKLKNAGIWQYFKAGGFGNASQKRSELVALALKEAEEKFGKKFKKENVYLIGDTVRDIQCAKKANVKIVAVATGMETMQELENKNPDYLFKDFSDTEKIMEVFR